MSGGRGTREFHSLLISEHFFYKTDLMSGKAKGVAGLYHAIKNPEGPPKGPYKGSIDFMIDPRFHLGLLTFNPLRDSGTKMSIRSIRS